MDRGLGHSKSRRTLKLRNYSLESYGNFFNGLILPVGGVALVKAGLRAALVAGLFT